MALLLPGAMSAPTHTDSQQKRGLKMNCCDEYGNCNQGRDCPIRATWVGKEILPVSTWRYKVKCLAYWMLMAILGLMIWPTLFYLFFRA